MAAEMGTATIKIEPELSNVFAIVIAAVRLHDAFWYSAPAISAELPDNVVDALAALQRAIRSQ